MFNFMENLILIVADRIVAAILTAPGVDKNTPYSARAAQYKKMLDEVEKIKCDQSAKKGGLPHGQIKRKCWLGSIG